MLSQLLNWRILLAFIAILIVSGTIGYSSYLAKKIERDERRKVEEWVAAGTFINNPANTDIGLASMIVLQTDLPIIETTESDSITAWVNLDSAEVAAGWLSNDSMRVLHYNMYLRSKLRSFKNNPPIEWINPADSSQRNRYYYGPSQLLQEVRYYPLVQLGIVGLFIAVVVLLLRSFYRSTQNQVWAGMAKETAHQLGTPVTSLEGWLEILRDIPGTEKVVPELEKDVMRLQLISDRFGKIGSKPQLERSNLVEQVGAMVEYIRKRAPGRLSFVIHSGDKNEIWAPLSPPLFDWVIENLLKNALDAMEGKGVITVDIKENYKEVIIDVTDTGKGIAKQNIRKVFRPGFTTKRRGWGLGLSLSKRIVEQYHGGSLSVKSSEPGKGTTFRVVLKK